MIEERDGGCGLVLRARPGDGRGAPAAGCRISGGFDGVLPAAPLWHGGVAPRGTARRPRAGAELAPAAELGAAGTSVDAAAFRDAMSRFPSGVTIVTTRDRLGRRWGFTASAFTSLSADPPLVLVCLDNEARCYPAFRNAERFAVAIAGPQHRDVALRFASKHTDKFGGGEFQTDESGLPRLPDAVASLVCVTHAQFPGGDHTIIVGRVVSANVSDGEPVVFSGRRFRTLSGPA